MTGAHHSPEAAIAECGGVRFAVKHHPLCKGTQAPCVVQGQVCICHEDPLRLVAMCLHMQPCQVSI